MEHYSNPRYIYINQLLWADKKGGAIGESFGFIHPLFVRIVADVFKYDRSSGYQDFDDEEKKFWDWALTPVVGDLSNQPVKSQSKENVGCSIDKLLVILSWLDLKNMSGKRHYGQPWTTHGYIYTPREAKSPYAIWTDPSRYGLTLIVVLRMMEFVIEIVPCKTVNTIIQSILQNMLLISGAPPFIYTPYRALLLRIVRTAIDRQLVQHYYLVVLESFCRISERIASNETIWDLDSMPQRVDQSVFERIKRFDSEIQAMRNVIKYESTLVMLDVADETKRRIRMAISRDREDGHPGGSLRYHRASNNQLPAGSYPKGDVHARAGAFAAISVLSSLLFGAVPYLYGGCINGFIHESSDMDIALILSERTIDRLLLDASNMKEQGITDFCPYHHTRLKKRRVIGSYDFLRPPINKSMASSIWAGRLLSIYIKIIYGWDVVILENARVPILKIRASMAPAQVPEGFQNRSEQVKGHRFVYGPQDRCFYYDPHPLPEELAFRNNSLDLDSVHPETESEIRLALNMMLSLCHNAFEVVAAQPASEYPCHCASCQVSKHVRSVHDVHTQTNMVLFSKPVPSYSDDLVVVEVDLMFNRESVIHNSSLIRTYSLYDERVHTALMYIQQWTKERDIRTPYIGTLSGYQWLLLFLSILQRIYVRSGASVFVPMLPNFQRLFEVNDCWSKCKSEKHIHAFLDEKLQPNKSSIAKDVAQGCYFVRCRTADLIKSGNLISTGFESTMPTPVNIFAIPRADGSIFTPFAKAITLMENPPYMDPKYKARVAAAAAVQMAHGSLENVWGSYVTSPTDVICDEVPSAARRIYANTQAFPGRYDRLSVRMSNVKLAFICSVREQKTNFPRLPEPKIKYNYDSELVAPEYSTLVRCGYSYIVRRDDEYVTEDDYTSADIVIAFFDYTQRFNYFTNVFDIKNLNVLSKVQFMETADMEMILEPENLASLEHHIEKLHRYPFGGGTRASGRSQYDPRSIYVIGKLFDHSPTMDMNLFASQLQPYSEGKNQLKSAVASDWYERRTWFCRRSNICVLDPFERERFIGATDDENGYKIIEEFRHAFNIIKSFIFEGIESVTNALFQSVDHISFNTEIGACDIGAPRTVVSLDGREQNLELLWYSLLNQARIDTLFQGSAADRELVKQSDPQSIHSNRVGLFSKVIQSEMLACVESQDVVEVKTRMTRGIDMVAASHIYLELLNENKRLAEEYRGSILFLSSYISSSRTIGPIFDRSGGDEDTISADDDWQLEFENPLTIDMHGGVKDDYESWLLIVNRVMQIQALYHNLPDTCLPSSCIGMVECILRGKIEYYI